MQTAQQWIEKFREQRRQVLTQTSGITGIDFIKVVRKQNNEIDALKIYFIPTNETTYISQLIKNIKKENIIITPGKSSRPIWLKLEKLVPSQQESNVLTIKLSNGDASALEEFNNFTLSINDIDAIDPFFDKAQFYTSEIEIHKSLFDLNGPPPLPIKIPFEIDYLCRDFNSLRQLMLDRLSFLKPGVQYHTCDLEMVIIELLAHVADQVTYYQDAIATEAYLGTARKRVSVKRHARLLGYRMHEGCNARVWVHIEIKGKKPFENKSLILKKGTQFLTYVPGFPTIINCQDSDAAPYNQILNEGAECFETMHDATFYSETNQFTFYNWGASTFKLMKGATNATLKGHFTHLRVGDVLVFKEILNPETGKKEGADPSHTHAVRIKSIKKKYDHLRPLQDDNGTQTTKDITFTFEPTPITEIEWYPQDYLPFDLFISAVFQKKVIYVSVALGNIVLADHGRTIKEKILQTSTLAPHQRGLKLTARNMIFSEPFDLQYAQSRPAKKVYKQKLNLSCPSLTLYTQDDHNRQEKWIAQPDLLNSQPWDNHFVAEIDNNRQAWIRFGDGICGKQPFNDQFNARYRIGDECNGEIGVGAIAHIGANTDQDEELINFCKEGELKISNPLPAKGSIQPQSIQEVKIKAPYFMKSRQERIITEEDYVKRIRKFPGVQEAAADLKWTGNLSCMYVAVERSEHIPLDAEFKNALYAYLDRFRLIGQEIYITNPQYVYLDIALTVVVSRDYSQETIHHALEEAFSPNATRGFFHPDHFHFGQDVYLDTILMTLTNIPGILSIDLTGTKGPPSCFQRLSQPSTNALKTGCLKMSKLEMARLENNPAVPERGRLQFFLSNEESY